MGVPVFGIEASVTISPCDEEPAASSKESSGLCAVEAGYMPFLLFVLIFYREFSQSFLRMVALKKGVAIAARMGGKLKTVFYIITGFFFLTLESYTRFAFPFIPEFIDTIIKTSLLWSTRVLFVVCVLLSWGSFIDYIKSFHSILKGSE